VNRIDKKTKTDSKSSTINFINILQQAAFTCADPQSTKWLMTEMKKLPFLCILLLSYLTLTFLKREMIIFQNLTIMFEG